MSSGYLFFVNDITIHTHSKRNLKTFSFYFTVPSFLRYEFYKASPHRIIVVLCSGWLFKVFLLTVLQHPYVLRRFCVALGVGGKECGKT